jgi:fused signal recognition particle receptor
MALFGLFNKNKKETLDKGLEKTKESVFGKLARAVAGKSKVDDDVLDDLEEILISSDVGVDTTIKIIDRIDKRVARDKYVSTSELNGILRDEIASLLTENNTIDADSWDLPSDHQPYVILVVGVNGVGKTTTIGKLAYQFKKAGKKVYLGAADTFPVQPLLSRFRYGATVLACQLSNSKWVLIRLLLLLILYRVQKLIMLMLCLLIPLAVCTTK